LGTSHGGLLMVFEKIKPCRFSLVIGDGFAFYITHFYCSMCLTLKAYNIKRWIIYVLCKPLKPKWNMDQNSKAKTSWKGIISSPSFTGEY
jgi:hypothetical protein